jgi:hypothetical protein
VLPCEFHGPVDRCRDEFISITVSCRIVLRADYKTPSFLRAFVDSFDDIDKLLFVLQNPVELVVISGTEITHHVFVSEEEHYGHRVIEFVHLIKILYLIQIANINDCKVLHTLGDAIKHFVLSHAVLIPVSTKPDHNKSLVLGHYGLVNMPAGDKMRKYDGSHSYVGFAFSEHGHKLKGSEK